MRPLGLLRGPKNLCLETGGDPRYARRRRRGAPSVRVVVQSVASLAMKGDRMVMPFATPTTSSLGRPSGGERAVGPRGEPSHSGSIPALSIVVPCFNRSALIADTLDSIAAQTVGSWECLVVDDGSLDDSREIVQAYAFRDPRVRLLVRPANRRKGANTCRNIGLERSAADLILFLDSDDLLHSECAERRLMTVRRSFDHDLWAFPIGSFVNRVGDSRVKWNRLTTSDPDDLRRFVLLDPPWSCISCVWLKSSLLEYGGWREGIDVWQDWELHIRALVLGARVFKSVDSPIDAYYRRSPEIDSISRESRSSEYRFRVLRCVEKVIDTLSAQRLIDHYRLDLASTVSTFVLGFAYRSSDAKLARATLQVLRRYRLLSPVQLLYVGGATLVRSREVPGKYSMKNRCFPRLEAFLFGRPDYLSRSGDFLRTVE